MGEVALPIAIISVLSPVVLALGILYLISASNIALPAVVLNLLTAIIGAVRFALDFSPSPRRFLTLLFVFVLVFTLVTDVRLGRKLFAAQLKRVKTKRIEIEPPNAWVVNKSAEERLAYKVPKSFLVNHPDYRGSDLNFRINCDDDVIPVEGTFSIDDKAQILLPPHILGQINKSQMIRFEIVE